MSESIEIIYNQIETDYDASFNIFKNRIPVDLNFYRREVGCDGEDFKQVIVEIPGPQTEKVEMQTTRDGRVLVTFETGENARRLGYEDGVLFLETSKGRHEYSSDLEGVRAAQLLRIVLMEATSDLDKELSVSVDI